MYRINFFLLLLYLAISPALLQISQCSALRSYQTQKALPLRTTITQKTHENPESRQTKDEKHSIPAPSEARSNEHNEHSTETRSTENPSEETLTTETTTQHTLHTPSLVTEHPPEHHPPEHSLPEHTGSEHTTEKTSSKESKEQTKGFKEQTKEQPPENKEAKEQPSSEQKEDELASSPSPIESADTKEPAESKATEESKDSKDPKELAKSKSESKAKSKSEHSEAKEHTDSKDHAETKELIESKGTKETNESKDSEENSESETKTEPKSGPKTETKLVSTKSAKSNDHATEHPTQSKYSSTESSEHSSTEKGRSTEKSENFSSDNDKEHTFDKKNDHLSAPHNLTTTSSFNSELVGDAVEASISSVDEESMRTTSSIANSNVQYTANANAGPANESEWKKIHIVVLATCIPAAIILTLSLVCCYRWHSLKRQREIDALKTIHLSSIENELRAAKRKSINDDVNNWSTCFDSVGRTYYVNLQTGLSTWTMPKCMMNPTEEEV